MKFICPKCHYKQYMPILAEGNYKANHIKILCSKCFAYIKFSNKKERRIIEARYKKVRKYENTKIKEYKKERREQNDHIKSIMEDEW